jgi:Flp pilus assembly protein TadG
MKPSKRNSQRGSNLVETSLILLTFLTMLIGVIDFGQVLYFHQSLVERARAAARYGAVCLPTCSTTNVQNVAVYNNSSPSGTPVAILPGMTTSMVNVQNLNANTADAQVVVTISNYPINFISPYIARQFNNRPVTVAMSAESEVP